MQEWLDFATANAAIIINAMALIIIAIGTVEMFFRGIAALFSHSATGRELRDAYLRYARWLIAGLTFQLAADIISTAIAPSWDEIGRLAAIAAIRTFLNYFLERDVREVRETQHERKADATI